MRSRWLSPLASPLAPPLAPLLAPLLAAFLLSCAPARSPAPPEDGGRALITEAQRLLADGDAPRAAASMRAVLHALPQQPLARAVLAHALLAQGDLEGAIVQGKLAVGADRSLSEASWNVACAYARLNDRDQAIAWLRSALLHGDYDRDAVRADPDFASLVDDHRIAVYLATGVLSRAEEDVLAMVDRPTLHTGETLTLSLALVQLNRPPLAPSSVHLAAGQDQGLPAFELLERRETLGRGEAGGSEYLQRSVHFLLRAVRPGPAVLGPFRVDGDDGVYWTSPLLVTVDGDELPRLLPPDPGFFALPSDVDAASDAPLWTEGEPLPRPALRYRLPTLEQLPPLPPRPTNARRSSYLRRSTEGASWTLDSVVGP